jgi:putative NADPH-quinone reductase
MQHNVDGATFPRRFVGIQRMEKKLVVVNGHPDPRPERLCAALCDAYEAGAKAGGWETRRLAVGTLAFSDIAPQTSSNEVPVDIADALSVIDWSDQLAIVYPLWLNQPPTILRALFDRWWSRNPAAVPGGARHDSLERVARIVVTMDMPALLHRSLYRKDDRNRASIHALSFPGIRCHEPILIGSVNTISDKQRGEWLDAVRLYGEQGALTPLFIYRKAS